MEATQTIHAESLRHSDMNEEPAPMREEVMITTVDNPYDYFTHFDEWLAYDNEKGYGTCSYLARIVNQLGGLTDDMTQKEQDARVSQAIDEIFKYTLEPQLYKKVSQTVQY